MSVPAPAPAPTPQARRARRRIGPAWLLIPVLAYLVAFMAVPVGQLLLLAFTTRSGALTLAHFERLFQLSVYVNVLWITVKLAALTTLFSVVFAYPVAYLAAISRHDTRARITMLILLPFWTSFLVRTFAWLVLLGRNGVVNSLLSATGLTEAPAELIFNFTAVLVAMCHAMMPICVMTMLSVMENIDRNLRPAAMTLGAPPGSAFWRIYFPLSMPGVAAAGLLVFISALGFFITPAFLGGRRETVITQVILEQVLELLNWPFAAALSVVLLVVTLAIFYLYDRAVGLSTLSGGAARSAAATKAGPVGRAAERLGRRILLALGRATDAAGKPLRWLLGYRIVDERGRIRPLHIVVGLVLVFLTAPAFVMVPISVTESNFIDWPPRGFSLRWYATFFTAPEWVAALTRSVVIGVFSSILAMAIGVPAAFMLARRQFRGKTAVIGFILSPLIVPRIIIAVALFYHFARLGLAGSILGLVLGHAVISVPYVVITVMAALKTFDERLEAAAWSLGARPWRAFVHVTFPLIRAGLVSAFLFAFITSFDELTIALFVSGGVTSTLPKQMWDDAFLRITPTLAAASTVLLAIVTAVVFATERLNRRSFK